MILGLDTTTTFLHLALVETPSGGQTWTQRVEVGIGRSHSTALLPSLDALMAEAGASPKDLTGAVACVGPGGFTSLRIGVATAEGLALTGVPTWGFSAFELRAQALREAGVKDAFWILLDGQRGDVFAQPWGESDSPSAPACKHPIKDLSSLLLGQPWWAPAEFADKINQPHRIGLDNEGDAMLAGLVALCRKRPFTPPESPLVPFYLRETDAEVNFPEASRHLPDALRQGHAR